MPDTSLVGKDLSGQDLRHRDLSGKVLFETDLRNAKLYGAKISLACETFDGVKLDDSQVALLLIMISKAEMDPVYQEGLRRLVYQAMGEYRYSALLRMTSLI